MACHFCKTNDHDFENPCQQQKDAFERMKKRSEERRQQMMEVERDDWPPPNHVVATWEAHGFTCMVARGMVALCGYVKVPVGHPSERLWYDDVPVQVHGGLTFRTRVKGGSWFGFDCGHFGDWWGIIENGHGTEHPGNIWTVDDVKAEVERLAKQFAEITSCCDAPKDPPAPPG